jgi:hypothetical protein
MMGVFDGTYDSYLALSLYSAYSNGSRTRDVLNELLLQVGPLVAIVSKAEIGPNSIGEGNLDALRVEALERVYEVFEDLIIDTDDPREFTAYLWTTIRRAMLRSIAHDSKLWDFASSETEVEDYGLPCEEINLAETRLYLSSFYELVYSVFKSDLRLLNNEREASLYFARCALSGNPPSANSLRFRFKLPRAKARFVASYSRCALKSAEHLVRQIDDNS